MGLFTSFFRILRMAGLLATVPIFLCLPLSAAPVVTITQSADPTLVAPGDTVSFCISVSSAASLPLVDVMWVIDVTGSMGDDIAEIRGKLIHFTDRLTGVGIDYRQGLVSFRDDPDVTTWGWSTDDVQFKYWTLVLDAAGGGDEPESALEALVLGAQSAAWRPGASRVMILVTDASMHTMECSNGILSLSTVATALATSGIVVHAVSPTSFVAGCAAKSLPPLTGGMWLDIASGDWTAMLATLGGEVASLTNVIIQDVLPAPLEPMAETTGIASYSDHVLTWEYANLSQGITQTDCFAATVAAGFATPVVNRVSFRADSVSRIWALPVTLYPRATNTPTPSSTPSMTRSSTPSPTSSATPSPTPSWTPSLTDTPTPTASATATPSSTDTWTPTPTATLTPSSTPTSTWTSTSTSTPVLTFTSTFTLLPATSSPTATPTPHSTPFVECGFHVWPNPYSPSEAVRGMLKVGCVPDDARVFLYTVSGEKVAELPVRGMRAEWDGRNAQGEPVAGGTYYLLVKRGTAVLHRVRVILMGSQRTI